MYIAYRWCILPIDDVRCVYIRTVLGEDKKIDDVYYLQMYEEGWNNGHWEERIDERPCVDESRFKQVTYSDIFIAVSQGTPVKGAGLVIQWKYI